MKKIFGLLVVLSMMVILPMGAKAIKVDTTNACDKSCPTKDGKCEQTCRINFADNNTPLTDLSFNITYGNGVKIKKITPQGDWTLTSGDTNNKVTLKAQTGKVISSKTFTAATVVFEVENETTDCSINVELEGIKYEIEVEQKIEQTQTGASLPIAIIGVGAVAAVVIYLSTKKSKKMYKI